MHGLCLDIYVDGIFGWVYFCCLEGWAGVCGSGVYDLDLRVFCCIGWKVVELKVGEDGGVRA